MSELDFPDLHHVRAAEGWLVLGALDEAAAELRRVSGAAQGHPLVLDLRWQLAARREHWEEALDIARLLVRAAPEQAVGWIHQSYALHELRRTAEAWEALLPMAQRFPEQDTIAYNLACYACQLGDLGMARDWIRKCLKARGKDSVLAMAREDRDLAPLLPWLETL